MINLTDVREKIAMDRRNELLARHKYDIWPASDGYWKTYLPDETRKNNRRPIKRKSFTDLQQDIIDYQEELERQLTAQHPNKRKRNITLNDLFLEWIDFKALHTNATSYVKRILRCKILFVITN